MYQGHLESPARHVSLCCLLQPWVLQRAGLSWALVVLCMLTCMLQNIGPPFLKRAPSMFHPDWGNAVPFTG